MPRIEGPENKKNIQFDKLTGKFVATHINDFVTNTSTLGKALQAYEKQYNVEIIPYDGRFKEIPLDENDKKYFLYKNSEITSDYNLVDVHIIKNNDEEICPRQNLMTVLDADDVIIIGILAC